MEVAGIALWAVLQPMAAPSEPTRLLGSSGGKTRVQFPHLLAIAKIFGLMKIFFSYNENYLEVAGIEPAS